jgi:Flp pilus assembly pilin Flp
MRNFITRLLGDRSGAAIVEFGVLAAFVTMLTVAGLTVVGDKPHGTSNPVSVALR